MVNQNYFAMNNLSKTLLISLLISAFSSPFVSKSQISSFETRHVYKHNSYLNVIASGDVFNNNENLLVLGTYQSQIIMLRWSDSSFTLVDTFLIPFSSPSQIGIFDIDNDNYKELIIAGPGNLNDTGQIIIYEYRNSSFKKEWDTFGVFFPSFNYGNTDNDSDNELVICNYQGDSISNLMVFNCRNNQYVEEFSLKVKDSFGYSAVRQPTINDFNGDNTNEIAFSNDNGYVWFIGFNGSNYEILNTLDPTPGGAAIVTSGNVDDDKEVELLIGTNGGLVEILTHDQDWDFTPKFSHDIGRISYQIQTGNIDTEESNEFVILHSNTNGPRDGQISAYDWIQDSFQLIWSDIIGQGFNKILLSNVDEDSDLELICTINDSLLLYEPFTKPNNISNGSPDSEFNIFPNPTSSILHIEGNTPFVYDIFNQNGEIIVVSSSSGTIDLQEFPEGIYTVKIMDMLSRSIKYQKIVKL